MADLFLSYARADGREFVARLAAALEARGKDPWVDLDDIPPASTWHDDLRSGIAASDSFCFVITPASVASEHCRLELEHAVALGKRIVPVLLLPVADASVPGPVAERNWVPQTGRFTDDFDTALDLLVEAVETDLDWVREHTRWGQRAADWEARGADRSVLARGADLDQAEAFLSGAAGREPAPTELQGRYVLASRRAATGRQRLVVGGVSVALVVALVLAVLAVLQRDTAVEQREEAERQRAAATSRALAANAFLTLPTDPELSVLLGLAAADASATTEAENALRSAVLESRVLHQLTREAEVTSASYAPDGSRLVTTSEDGTGAIWDADSGRLVAELTGHTQSPQEARWSADGSRVVTIATDGTARVYDATGAPVSVITATDEYRLTDVAISADGSVVVTAAFVQGQVHLWDATTGTRLGTVPRSTVDRIALSPDGSLLLLAVQQEAVELWRTTDLSLVASFPEDAQGFFGAVAFAPDGSTFVSAGADGLARVRTRDGDLVADVQHDGAVEAVAFSPDGGALATAGEDGLVQVTDLGDGDLVTTYAGHAGPVETVAFSPLGDLVASAGEDGAVQLWRPTTGSPVASLVGHRGPVNQVAFRPDGAEVVSASDDSTARVWAATGAETSFPERAAGEVGRAFEQALAPGGRYASVVLEPADDGTTVQRTLDVETGAQVGEFALGDDVAVRTLSADGTLTVTTGYDGTARVRRTADGSVVAEVSFPFAQDAAFDDGGGRVLLVGEAGAAAIVDATTGAELVTLAGHDPDAGEVAAAGFGAAGTRALTAGLDGTARVWDAGTGEQLVEVPAFGEPGRMALPAATVALSPDGTVLATGAGWENDARLWDAETGDPVATLEGVKGGGITDISFSADGRFVVTTAFSGAVRLWDARSGRPLAPVTDAFEPAQAAAFVGDDDRVALLGEDAGATRLLVVDCLVCGGLRSLVALGRTRVTRELTAPERATYLTTG